MTDILVIRWRAEPPPIEIRWRGGGTECFVATINAGEPIATVIGPRGPAGGTTISRTAGEALGGHRAARCTADERAFHADKDDLDPDAVMGVTVGAVGEGDAATIQISGMMVESSWNWSPGAVWLGSDGILTQTVPTTGALVRIGTATGVHSLKIEPRLIARLL